MDSEFLIVNAIRGRIESILDDWLKEEVIEPALIAIRDLEPIIKNYSDVILGFILGGVAAEHMYLYRLLLKREPNKEEIDEIFNSFIRRLTQLRSKIIEVMKK